MPQPSIHALLTEMEAMVETLRESLAQDLDFAGFEQTITGRLNELGAELVKQVMDLTQEFIAKAQAGVSGAGLQATADQLLAARARTKELAELADSGGLE